MIPQNLIEKYIKENPKHGHFVNVLNKFGVVGFDKQYDMNMVMLWLDKNKITYEKNDRFLIWIETLSEPLKKTFRRK